MRLFSWNVNGIRAASRKGFLDWLATEQPDIVGLQETRAHPEQLDAALRQPAGYHAFWAAAERKGYSGVALLTKEPPRHVQVGLGIPAYDAEGRTIVAEFDDFVFITAYFPNGSRDHSRVPFKMAYKRDFRAFCDEIRRGGQHVVFCGDVNTAHHPIDLARPRQNEKHTGFLPEERVWLDDLVANGYVDTFRHCHPQRSGAYSWWSFIGGARRRNVGWRLDYFFVNEELLPAVTAADIHAEVMGSDHCPVSLTLASQAPLRA